jgi:NAD(P)-dependent dehydrogenase (short-subunit alcohol dehydrogenase family)
MYSVAEIIGAGPRFSLYGAAKAGLIGWMTNFSIKLFTEWYSARVNKFNGFGSV